MQGVPVSPGVAVARAYCLNQALARREPDSSHRRRSLRGNHPLQRRLRRRRRGTHRRHHPPRHPAGRRRRGGHLPAAHKQLLRDPAFHGKVRAAVTEKQNDAGAAVQQTVQELSKTLFSHINDTYIQERIADLQRRGRPPPGSTGATGKPAGAGRERAGHPDGDGNPAVAGRQLRPPPCGPAFSPSAASAAGHTAILARSLNIPAVSGLEGLTSRVRDRRPHRRRWARRPRHPRPRPRSRGRLP